MVENMRIKYGFDETKPLRLKVCIKVFISSNLKCKVEHWLTALREYE